MKRRCLKSLWCMLLIVLLFCYVSVENISYLKCYNSEIQNFGNILVEIILTLSHEICNICFFDFIQYRQKLFSFHASIDTFYFAMVVPFNKNENKLCRISPGYRTNNVFVMFCSPLLPSLHSIQKEFKRKFVANIKPNSKNYMRLYLRLYQAKT